MQLRIILCPTEIRVLSHTQEDWALTIRIKSKCSKQIKGGKIKIQTKITKEIRSTRDLHSMCKYGQKITWELLIMDRGKLLGAR